MSQKNYNHNISEAVKKSIAIIGGGFAGLKFVQKSLCDRLVLKAPYLIHC